MLLPSRPRDNPAQTAITMKLDFTIDRLRRMAIFARVVELGSMSAAARDVYTALRRDGTQQSVIAAMQTRAELYEVLGYHAYEQKLDELFKNKPQT